METNCAHLMEPPLDIRRSLSRFENLREIGEGSFSVVYYGVDKENGRQVAIKSCLKAQIIKEKKAQYVHREKAALGRLSDGSNGHHPLILKLYATLQDQDHLYFVLSYAENGDLLHHMWKQPNRRFSLSATVFYTAEIVSAMQHCHKLSIVHRDIKPENVLLQAGGHIVLSDFGSCKDLSHSSAPSASQQSAREAAVAKRKAEVNRHEGSDSSSSGDDGQPPPSRLVRRCSFVGTAQYVSPEILKGGQTTRAMDYWSLGVVIFQLLTGRHAFHDEAEYLIFRRVQSALFSFPDDFPPIAKDLVEKLIVVEPSARLGCASCGDVSETAPGGASRVTTVADDDEGPALLRNHAFFVDVSIPWDDITSMRPPESTVVG